jgi:microcystin-dependent protein
MGQWLTPDDAYSDLRCVSVYIPSGEEYTGALLGALSLLRAVSSWEQFGAQSPEDTAAAFDAGWQQTLDEIDQECGDNVAVPIGTICAWPISTPPDGWLACDGSSVHKSEYADLFALIGTTYGAGDSLHFVLPDMRDRFAIGAGTNYNEGDTGGEATHTLTTAEMPSHRHSVSVRNTSGSDNVISMAINRTAWAGYTGYTGGGNAHNNIPPYLGLNWIIYAGV